MSENTERKGRGPAVKLPDTVTIAKPRKNEVPPESSGRGRSVSALQTNLRNMVTDLEHGAWFKIAIEGEKEQRALGNHLRNAVQATHEGMSVGLTFDEGNVWFRIQPKSNRGRKAKES